MRAQHSTAHQSSGKKINENELHHQRINASTSGKEEGTERNMRCRAVQLEVCSCRDESKEKEAKGGTGSMVCKGNGESRCDRPQDTTQLGAKMRPPHQKKKEVQRAQ